MAKKACSQVKTGEIVISAIKKLMKNTGWTARTITKFIRMEYEVNDSELCRRVSRALKRGVKLGLLQAQGRRYRLSEMSQLARNVSSRDIRKRQRQKPTERPLRMRSRSSVEIKKKKIYR